MDYELTQHAMESLRIRSLIRREWLERVLQHPARIEPDPVDPDLEHRLGAIIEFDGRVLRVILDPNRVPVRIITAYFDRRMRGKL